MIMVATAAKAQVSVCDVNSDGSVNSADVVAIYNKIITGEDPQAPMPSITKTFYYNGVPFTFVAVEGGTYLMGASRKDNSSNMSDNPQHEVSVNSFYIGQTEVTQAQWKALMGETSTSKCRFQGDNLPVEYVTHQEALVFCLAMNLAFYGKLPEGKIFRLAYNAEWEYAARGGRMSKGCIYSGSDTMEDVAWCDANSENKTHPVATKAPNELGIYDMSGNVAEWCMDYYDYSYYKVSPKENPTGPEKPLFENDYVIRGGNYQTSEYQGDLKVCRHDGMYQPLSANFVGLRLVIGDSFQ